MTLSTDLAENILWITYLVENIPFATNLEENIHYLVETSIGFSYYLEENIRFTSTWRKTGFLFTSATSFTPKRRALLSSHSFALRGLLSDGPFLLPGPFQSGGLDWKGF
jgi:hypothetical protein